MKFINQWVSFLPISCPPRWFISSDTSFSMFTYQTTTCHSKSTWGTPFTKPFGIIPLRGEPALLGVLQVFFWHSSSLESFWTQFHWCMLELVLHVLDYELHVGRKPASFLLYPLRSMPWAVKMLSVKLKNKLMNKLLDLTQHTYWALAVYQPL